MNRCRIAGPTLLCLLLWSAHAFAQGGARSMDIDTSIRAAGMGGASTGVTWGQPNVWSNPASLGAMSGVWVEHGRSQLVVGLASDVFIRSDRFLVGGNGIGFAFSGQPDHLGGIDLDYGPDGYETVDGASFGFSLPRLFDGARKRHGHESHLAETFDLSAGWTRKHTVVALAPWDLSGVATGDTRDWGVLARLSPLEWLPASSEDAYRLHEALILDLGWGHSVLNSDDTRFVFGSEDISTPPTRGKRTGYSVRAGARLPQPLALRGLKPLWPALSPLVTVGYAHDHEDNDAGGTGAHRYKVNRDGFEVNIADVFTWRHGHVEDRLGEIIGDSGGWGLGLPIGPWAAVRMDHAQVPQARNSGLPDVKRRGWSLWFDPIRIFEDLSKTGER